MHRTRVWFEILGVMLAIVVSACAASAQTRQPNIVMIDHGALSQPWLSPNQAMQEKIMISQAAKAWIIGKQPGS